LHKIIQLINSAVMTSSARSTATILTPRDDFEALDYARPPSEKFHNSTSRSSRHHSRRNQYRRSEKSMNSRPSRRENSSYVSKRDHVSAPRANGSIHSSAAYSKRSSKSSSAGHHSDRSRRKVDPVDKYPHDQYL